MRRFKMGDIVIVCSEYDRHYQDKKIDYVVKTVNPRAGWIVGERNIYNGERWYEEECGYIFESTKCYRCYLVAYWPTMKPVKVPMNALYLANGTMEPHSPMNSEPYRRDLRNAYKANPFPRDKKGRFISE